MIIHEERTGQALGDEVRIYRLAQPLHPSLKPGEMVMFRDHDRSDVHLVYGTDREWWFSGEAGGYGTREAMRAMGHEIIGTFLGHPKWLGIFPRRGLARVRMFRRLPAIIGRLLRRLPRRCQHERTVKDIEVPHWATIDDAAIRHGLTAMCIPCGDRAWVRFCMPGGKRQTSMEFGAVAMWHQQGTLDARLADIARELQVCQPPTS